MPSFNVTAHRHGLSPQERVMENLDAGVKAILICMRYYPFHEQSPEQRENMFVAGFSL
jgi:hypothetical protein